MPAHIPHLRTRVREFIRGRAFTSIFISQWFSKGSVVRVSEPSCKCASVCQHRGGLCSLSAPISIWQRPVGRPTDRLTRKLKMEAFHTSAISTWRAMPPPCFHHRYRRQVFSWSLASQRTHYSGLKDILNLSYALSAWSCRSLRDTAGSIKTTNRTCWDLEQEEVSAGDEVGSLTGQRRLLVALIGNVTWSSKNGPRLQVKSTCDEKKFLLQAWNSLEIS